MEHDDGIECCGFDQSFSESDLTDVRNDIHGAVECGEESTGAASVAERVERRRRLKRRYGICGTAAAAVAVDPERRLRSRIHDQFASLRELVPNLCTDEKGSILTGACEYIEKLRREEAELRSKLGIELASCDEEDLSCCEDEVSFSSWREAPESELKADEEGSSAAGCSTNVNSLYSSYGSSTSSCSSTTPQPTSKVEVRRTEAGLRIHIECGMRPGLLLAIMELLESSGLTVEEANVDCMGRLVFDGLGLEEVEESTIEGGECRNDVTLVSAEYLSASLRSLIDD